ncbi:hypothetical protein [Aliarcobacter butzleri]|nr:hypothetical protein [Aliarcobacter butzleri]
MVPAYALFNKIYVFSLLSPRALSFPIYGAIKKYAIIKDRIDVKIKYAI